MASTSQPVNPQPAGRQSFGTRMNQFWQRVTNGLELNQLWNQFRTDARASYRLYSREIDSTPKEGVKKGRHWWEVSKQFFWAILEKLSPARRVLLLVALLMILFNPELSWSTKEGTHIIGFDLRLWGGLLIQDVYAITQRLVIKRVNSLCDFLRAVRTSPPVLNLCMSLRDGHLQWCVGHLEWYELLPMLGPGKSPRSLQPLVKRRRGQGGE